MKSVIAWQLLLEIRRGIIRPVFWLTQPHHLYNGIRQALKLYDMEFYNKC
jgi:hypothetical protein